MDKNVNKANEPVEGDPFKGIYCKDVTSIMAKNAANHALELKVTQQLERERLTAEHEDIDKRIAATLKRIEKSQKVSQDLDLQIYNAKELKTQSMTRYERTGEMLTTLKDAAENVLSQSQSIEAKREEIAKKVEELKGKKTKQKQLKKQIEQLEQGIQKELNTPEPQMHPNLVEKNTDLKRRLKEKMANLKLKRAKKSKIEELKNETLTALRRVTEAQSRNDNFRAELAKKAERLKEKGRQLQEKFDEMNKNLKQDLEKRDTLLIEYEKLVQQNEERKKKFEALKQRVHEKENELTNLKQKIKEKENYMKQEHNKKQKEYEAEMQTLKTTEQEIQDCLLENHQYRQTILEKSDQIVNINNKKCDLTIQLYEQKHKLTVRQQQNANQEAKKDALAETLASEMRQLDELKTRHADLDRKLEEVKKELEELPLETRDKCEKIAANHQEKKQALLKHLNFENATVEFMQLELNEKLTKLEQLKEEVDRCDKTIQWEEMRCEMKKKTVERLQERLGVKKQFQTQRALLETNKGPMKEDIDVMEEEDKTLESRPRSPGILKSPYKNPNTQASKRVSFEGLSTTSSSPSTSNSTVQDPIMEELLREYPMRANNGSSSAGKRRPMDF